jgi:hypothetical protein
MKFFSLVENVMLKLGVLPGMGFLQRYVTDIRARKTQIGTRIQHYQGYVHAAREAGGGAAEAARSLRNAPESDEEESNDDYEEEDDESYMQ